MYNLASLLNKMRQALNIIPKEYDSELDKERINTNLNRLVILSIGLIIVNFFTIAVDVKIYFQLWDVNQIYKHLFIAHLWALLDRSLYVTIIYLIKTKNLNYNYKFKKILVLYNCTLSLVWCIYSSINTQILYGHSYVFLIGSFCVASAVLLLPAESITIFIFNSVFFTYMQYMYNKNTIYFAANAISAAFVFIFVLAISLINISQYYKNYYNKRVIELQAKELLDFSDKLEETVRIRTEQLVKANEQLVKEMGIRQDIEMQSIKTKLMYEENNLLLKEIKEYEELRNVFFANLSHELRTPLNVIFSAQQMMNYIIDKQPGNQTINQLTKYNKIVKQNCYRLIRLIGNLIDITKIDAKYFEITKKNCDIVKLTENITQSVAVYIKDKNIDLSFDTEITEKIIACDPDKIERILLNLLSNAVKFTSENGQINVKLSLVQGYVSISVKDNGIGISKEMQNVVFERFVQADKSMARNREGSGIGLSLVKSLVDLHQGKIYLHSESGKGSEFVVQLPDISIPFEGCVACSSDDSSQNIERISIEFSDIYS